ncbi:MAG: hypothetical protein R3247_05700 [Rhodothermales bacterium]|nr:hypothetical protein [Rhodothermales bacterium]
MLATRKGGVFKSRPVEKYVEWSALVEGRARRRVDFKQILRRQAYERKIKRGLGEAHTRLGRDSGFEARVRNAQEAFDLIPQPTLTDLLRVPTEFAFAAEALGLDNPDDLTYTGSKPYTPAMRLTTAHYAGRTGWEAMNLRQIKGTDWKRPDAPVGRPESTGSAMGRAINGGGSLTAWAHAGYPEYKDDPKASAEWCHLLADSLGGPTESGNLVAASYSANTYMAAIESQVANARGAFEIKIEAYGLSPHVAELIIYRVRATAGPVDGPVKSDEFWIDGRCTGFSAGDFENIKRRVEALA